MPSTPQYKVIPKYIRDMPIALPEVSRIIHNAGAERVASLAVGALTEFIYEYGKSISKRAIEIARHSNRTTVKEQDIRLAVELIGEFHYQKFK